MLLYKVYYAAHYNYFCGYSSLCSELGLDRYKFVVHVVIGEQRGEGVK